MKVTDIRIRIGRQTENIERLKAYADIYILTKVLSFMD